MSETYLRCDGCQSSAPADLFPPDALHRCGGKWRERDIHELDAPAPRDPAAGATPAREETPASLFEERHYLGAPLRGHGFASDVVMVPREWYERLKAAALRERDAAREDAENVEWLMAHASYVQLGNEALHATVVFDVPRGMDLRSALRAARAATAEGRSP